VFTLAEALNQGMSLSKTYNAPSKITIEVPGGEDYVVANYADASQGTLDLVQATAKSSNTAYVQLMQDVGPENVVSLARRMGITSELNPDLSLTLGTAEVSVLDMAAAYSTLANGGERRQPYVVSKVTDAFGNVLYEHKPTTDRVLSEDVTAEVSYALSQVVENGTGTAAKFGQPAAGKTGTTEEYRDAWFVGYTCKLTTAVWMGYPEPEEVSPGVFQARLMKNVHGKSVTGGSFPTQIWQRYMSRATEGLESCPFPRPADRPSSLDTPTSSLLTGPTTTVRPSTTTTTAPPSSTTTAPPATTTTTAPTTTSSTTSTSTPAGPGGPP
jgi:penicillin-binding protein 1A